MVPGGGTLDSDGDCRDVSRALKDMLCIFSNIFLPSNIFLFINAVDGNSPHFRSHLKPGAGGTHL